MFGVEVLKKPEKEIQREIKICRSSDVFELMEVQDIKNAVQEHMLFIGLDRGNNIRSIKVIGIGGSDGIFINTKNIVRTAMMTFSDKVILVHNHPSNTLKASNADLYLTNSINKFLKVFDIELLDHVIVAENGYISMMEKRQIDKNFENDNINFIEKTLLIEENQRLKRELENQKYKEMKGENSFMKKYESIIIMKPTMSEEEKKKALDSYTNFFESLSNKPVKMEDLGVKKLAYEIQHNKEGSYAVFNFYANENDITDLERKYRTDENVMKFLTVRQDENIEENNEEFEESDDMEF